MPEEPPVGRRVAAMVPGGAGAPPAAAAAAIVVRLDAFPDISRFFVKMFTKKRETWFFCKYFYKKTGIPVFL